MNEFKKLGLSEKTIKVLEELKFTKPSEIQEKTIPLILEKRDVIGNAATGSGKTLAFASGIIESLEEKKGIQALVLTPTRELADQIAKVTRIFAKNTNLKVQEIYGGVNLERQVQGAEKAEIIVATPGRMLDHLERRSFNLKNLKILVLDEADRMVDMGFLPDVTRIIESCPEERQTLLFSATTSADVQHMSKKYMKNPITITVEQYVDPSKLKQHYYDVPSHLKFSLLVHLLKGEESGIIMVFCNTRRNVDLVASNLSRFKINNHAIHGGMEQNKRTRIIEQFHKNQAEILICTDVAARGLDIKGVTHVYNYDTPKTSEEYIHRIGRTARAGREGMAVTLLSSRDYDNFRKVTMDESLKIQGQELPHIEPLAANFKSERRGNRDNHRRGFGTKDGRGRHDNGFRGRSYGNRSRDNRSQGNSGFRKNFNRNTNHRHSRRVNHR